MFHKLSDISIRYIEFVFVFVCRWRVVNGCRRWLPIKILFKWNSSTLIWVSVSVSVFISISIFISIFQLWTGGDDEALLSLAFCLCSSACNAFCFWVQSFNYRGRPNAPDSLFPSPSSLFPTLHFNPQSSDALMSTLSLSSSCFCCCILFFLLSTRFVFN